MTASITTLLILVFSTNVLGEATLADLFNAGSYSKSPTIEIVKEGRGEPEITLKYLTLRALAEVPVLILEESGRPYKAIYYGKKDFVDKYKKEQPLGRVPVINVAGRGDNVQVIAQSGSIVRYLGKRYHMDGDGSAEVDMLYETVKELHLDAEALKMAQSVTALPLLHYKDTSNGGNYTSLEKTLTFLATFESFLKKSPSGFLHGDSCTYADLALWVKLSDLTAEYPKWLSSASLPIDLPGLRKFYASMSGRNAIQDYVQSNRRMPRIKKEIRNGMKDYFYVDSPSYKIEL